MSESEGPELSRRLAGVSPAALASPLEDDDLLREILLRLPPQPSSLPRVSTVCKHWRDLVNDAKFLRRFRVQHQQPPLLGVFEDGGSEIVFRPILRPPDCIPLQLFNLGHGSRSSNGYELLDCRHGLVLVQNRSWTEVVVCDPITNEQRHVAVPPKFKTRFFNGAVLCATGDKYMHGGCHSSPFKVVLMSMYRKDHQPLACVYSSETGAWGNVISTDAPYELFYAGVPATLVGTALYCLSISDAILEFGLDEHSLTLIRGPFLMNDFEYSNCQIVQVEGNTVGFAILSYPHLHIWQRNVNGHGLATWVPWKAIGMHNILKLPPRTKGHVGGKKIIRAYDEDADVIFLHVDGSDYMVHLKSMQSSKLYQTKYTHRYHPFRSFYTPGTSIAVESNGAKILHKT